MSDNGAESLASLYRPPLGRFPGAGMTQARAKAAAWGQALEHWLAGYVEEKTRRDYRQAVADLLGFCRKLPWEVRPADVANWSEARLAGKANHTQNNALGRISRFYRFACGESWTSPRGRRLRLCRSDPVEGLARPKAPAYQRVMALNEAELGRLLAAFDQETPFGRRDLALFTVMLESALHLREALNLRLGDIFPADEAEGAEGRAGRRERWPGQEAAWQAVRAYLEADGRLAGMEVSDYVFTPLEDVAGAMARRNPQGWEGQPLGEWTALRAFKQYVSWAGLDAERVRPETLRYTGARRLLEAGAGEEEVAAFLRLKSIRKARQVMKRLKGKRNMPGRDETGRVAEEVTPEQSRGALIRRRPGGQPENRNNLKHGLRSSRYRVGRMRFSRDSFQAVDDAGLARLIAELQEKTQELLELPEESPEIMVKRLRKMSYMVYTLGQLKTIRGRKK